MPPELSPVDQRIQDIMDWVRAHRVQIAQEESVEIVINVSGDSLKGKITQYTKWGKRS